MIPVVFINCSRVPFIDLILRLLKVYETRTRNMLRSLAGQRVFLAETGRGRPPLVRCSAVIGEPVVACSRSAWAALRRSACIKRGSAFDWQPGTKKKYLYPLSDVQPCVPFTPPEGVRHGRVWMEYIPDNMEG